MPPRKRTQRKRTQRGGAYRPRNVIMNAAGNQNGAGFMDFLRKNHVISGILGGAASLIPGVGGIASRAVGMAGNMGGFGKRPRAPRRVGASGVSF